MAETAGSIERVATELAEVFTRITNKLGDDSVIDTFEQLGVHFPDQFRTEPTISAARLTVYGCGAELRPLSQQLTAAIASGDQAAVTSASFALVTQFGRVVDALPELANALATAGPTLPGITKAQIDELTQNLPRKIVDLLVADVLRLSAPAAALLQIFGIIERTFVSGDDTNPSKPPHERVSVHLDQILPALTNPVGHLGTLYGWGTPNFEAGRLLSVIEAVVAGLGLPVLFIPGTETEPPRLQIFAFDLEPTADGSGLKVEVMLRGALSTTFTFPVSPPTWNAEIGVSGTLPAGASGELRPPLDLKLTPPAGPFEASVTVELKATPPTPFLLLGTAGGSRLEFAGLSLGGGIALTFDPGTGKVGGGPIAEGEITGGKLIIDTSSGDGFISTLLGQLRLESRFDVGFSFTPEEGLRFHGSGGLEIQVPVHVELGPVQLQAIYLLATIGDGKLPIELSAGFTARLGPISAAVDRIGMRADLSFPGSGGNLGPADLAFAFKPPNGVGLSVDAAIISGGGYLLIDPDRGEYAGALELEFADFIELKAIGLISTRMPDGSTGFSLLIVVTAEFGGTGLQLGYGFTLLAVGGLIGLNRRMNLQALVEGVRTGRVESVMFPQDVVANAPRILSDLREFFPPERDKFLIGPMAKIGWGTPTLISVSLGVIIEIPGNIAILGVMRCVLPTQQLPLLVLQVDFIGAIEFDKSRLWFFAQLFDSRILFMTIEGGMGLLVGWGDNPDFVLTVGGFHPSFKPPPLPFSVPNRLSVDILNTSTQLIRVSAYFAITSNTVQFGAKAELRLGFSDFGIEGHLGFDALFQFSPFKFVIAISAGVSLKAFGVGLLSIDLRFQLEGPAPWRAHGTGSISILFFEISADFDITWGEKTNPTLPPVEVLQLLATEIIKLEGWRTQLPTGGTKTLVNLRTLPATDELVLHPLGTLFVRQRSIPLDVRLDRLGAQRPSDGKRFSVTPAPDSGLVQASVIGDKFAMAQFQDMDDAAKLSRPAYEEQDAGLELTAAAGLLASAARVVRRSARYELHIKDSGAGQGGNAIRARRADRRIAAVGQVNGNGLVNGNGPAKGTVRRFQDVSPAVFTQLLRGSSTSRSVLSQQEARSKQPFATDDTVQVAAQRFVIAYIRTNLQAFPPGGAGITASFRSQATALDALAEWVATDPSLAGKLHVIPESEATAPLAIPGTWSAVSPAPTAVSGSGSVLLTGGEVLTAGGADGAGRAVAAVAVFDPVTKTWAAAPPLSTARRRHSTTRLDDGRVLVAGGVGANGAPLSSAEIYDPVAKTWAATDSLGTARFAHAAVLLDSGKVLVAGGTGARGTEGGGSLSSAELYDPATNEWTDTAAMTDARSGHPAISLPDGRVLVVGGALTTGGEGQETALAYCELYDPAAGTWTPTASLNMPRKRHQATVLTDGSVLATGGDAPGIPAAGAYRLDSLASAERYNPAGNVWEPVQAAPGGRGRHRSVLLRSGKVLVIGGTSGPRHAVGFRNTTTYDPVTGTWNTTPGLVTGRSDFTAIELSDGRVLVAGGITRSGAAAPGPDPDVATSAAELFTP